MQTTRPHDHDDLELLVRDGVARALGAVGLAGVALIHAIDAPGHLTGGPDTWLGVMYLGLIGSCLALAAVLVVGGWRRVWAGTGVLMILVIAGYVLSRTTGLPGDTADIGNWGEPLGIAALFVEGLLVVLGGTMSAVGGSLPSRRPSRSPVRGEATGSARARGGSGRASLGPA